MKTGMNRTDERPKKGRSPPASLVSLAVAAGLTIVLPFFTFTSPSCFSAAKHTYCGRHALQ